MPGPDAVRSLSRRSALAALVGGGALAFEAGVARGSVRRSLFQTSDPVTGGTRFTADSPSTVPLAVRGAPRQTAHLFEAQEALGTPLLAVTATGAVHLPAQGPGHAPFAWEAGLGPDFGPNNPASSFGYNVGLHGRRLKPSEPTVAYVMEADYDDGSKRTMELYSEFTSADGTKGIRPFFFQVRRNPSAGERFLTRASIMGDPLVIEGPDGMNHVLVENSHTRFLAPANSPADGDNGVSIEARSGRSAFFAMGADGESGVLRLLTDGGYPDVATVELRGRIPLRLWSRLNGAPGAGMSVGAHDNSAVGLFAVGASHPSVKGLIVRGRKDQSAELMELQSADGSVLSSVTPEGLHRWSRNGEATAAGAAGAAAPPPNAPEKYLRVVDSTGQVLLLPAYRPTAGAG